MSVRAKFVVQSIQETLHWDRSKGNIKTIRLTPVTGDSGENKEFFAATPSGSIELGTVNADAASQFEPGQEFYVDFTPA